MSPEEASTPYPAINALECKSCGRCVAACPVKCLAIGEELNARGYRPAVYCGAGCVGCGNCYYTCPEPNCLEVHIPAKKAVS